MAQTLDVISKDGKANLPPRWKPRRLETKLADHRSLKGDGVSRFRPLGSRLSPNPSHHKRRRDQGHGGRVSQKGMVPRAESRRSLGKENRQRVPPANSQQTLLQPSK